MNDNNQIVDVVLSENNEEQNQELEQKPTVKYSISASVLSDGSIDVQTTGEDVGISELLGLIEFMKVMISQKATQQFTGFETQLLHAKLDLILRAAGIIK